jgi:hypothetical protein
LIVGQGTSDIFTVQNFIKGCCQEEHTTKKVKIPVVYDVMPCSLVETYQCFVPWEWKHHVLKHFDQSTWCQLLEDNSLLSHCCDNLKSYMQEKCLSEECTLIIIVLFENFDRLAGSFAAFLL